MNNYLKYFILCIVASFLNSSSCKENKNCPEASHDQIIINNNSNFYVNWIKDDNPLDSIWTNNGSTFPGKNDGIISPSSNYQIAAGLEGCWEYFYQGGHSEYYFIFNHDTVQAIGWEKIDGTNRGMLKRIKVDIDYLNNNNFTINFP